jgi:hypothetical protein
MSNKVAQELSQELQPFQVPRLINSSVDPFRLGAGLEQTGRQPMRLGSGIGPVEALRSATKPV